MGKVTVDHSKYDNIRFDIQDESAIRTDLLETIPYEYPGKDTEVVIPTSEFTTVCPWSGLPDFADLTITFIPDKYLIEMKSLKYYLTSFRNVGIYQEHATNRILKDLVELAKPKYMKVEAVWNPRGGLGTRVRGGVRKEGLRKAPGHSRRFLLGDQAESDWRRPGCRISRAKTGRRREEGKTPAVPGGNGRAPGGVLREDLVKTAHRPNRQA